MDWTLIGTGIFQLLVATLAGAVATFLGVVLFDRATRGIDEWLELERNNPAVGIVLGAIVLAVAWMLRPALQVSVQHWDIGAARVLVALGIQLAQILVGLVIAVLAIVFALWVFDRLTTRLDEWAELKRGNTAVAALLAGVIVGVSLLVEVVLGGIYAWFTPFLF